VFNFTLAVCMLIIGYYCGNLFAKKFINRASYFKSFKRFNRDFIAEIGFSQKNLQDILLNEYSFSDFDLTLKSKKIQLTNDNAVLYIPPYLSDNEKKEIEEYFTRIGTTDLLTQNRVLCEYDKIIDEKSKIAIDEEKKYSTLFKKTGVLVGLIAFIIVV